MNSEVSPSEIRALVLEAESNLKKIERYNDSFVYVTLNEWRYAVRHAVDSLCDIDATGNRAQAINHLKRARYDSYDILLDCLLARFETLHCEYRDYTPVVREYIPDYAEKLKETRKARNLHATYRDSSDRDALYEQLKEHTQKLELFLDDLESTADDWRVEIRKARAKDRWTLVAAMAGILGTVFAGVALLWH